MSTKKLEGKVAIITGGASGIGKAAACLFVYHGARMVVIGAIQDQLGQQVASSTGFEKCCYIHCDVADEEQVEALVEWTVRNYGQLDITFSNIGIIRSKKGNPNSNSDQNILDLDLDHLFAVNVCDMSASVKHAGRAMVEQGVRGSIISASTAASGGGVVDTDYFMSKHAVLGLVRSASRQLGLYGIRVNNVSPSVVVTTSIVEVEEVAKVYESRKKLEGVVLKETHVADDVLFLASQDSKALIGHDMVVG